MQNAGRQFLFMKRRGKAKDIRIEDELRADACAERIAVHAYDAGERSAVGIKRRGRIVRFDFKNQIRLIVELNDARVVNEDGQAEIFLAFGFADFGRRAFNVGFKKRVEIFSL